MFQRIFSVKKKGFLSLLFFLTMLFHAVPGNAWNGRVVKVLDGDSLLVRQGAGVCEVRLYGVDAPEYDQSYSRDAKKFVRNFVLYKDVSILEKDRDRYGRLVAQVERGGEMLNRELVRNGFAWVYSHFCREQPFCSELKGLQSQARKQRLGLWRGAKPVSPWSWRHRRRK